MAVAGAPTHEERSRVEKGVCLDALLLCRESRLEHLDGDCVCPGFAGLLGVLFWPWACLFLLLTWLCHAVEVKLRKRRE
jgi:hypothetical protein